MLPKKANSPWTLEEEISLYGETGKGVSVAEIAAIHDRTEGAITSRQRQMGLRNEAGELISPLPEFRSHLRKKEDNGTRPSSRGKPRRKRVSPSVLRASGGARSENPTAAQPVVIPEDFPQEGNWIEKLWRALCLDINALLKDGRQPEAIDERGIDIALTRLTPADDFYPAAKLVELGNKYGVTRERIRQIEEKVLRRLEGRVRRENSQTAHVLEKMAEAAHSEHGDAPLSWFATELTTYDCHATFKKFMLKAFLRHQGHSEQEAQRLTDGAMSSIPQIKPAEASPKRLGIKDDGISDKADKANEFVLGILKKAAWPDRLNEQLIDLSGFHPLRDCKSARPYYSKTLERLVRFDSFGELRLIRALDCCTVVAEFVEQPVRIDYRLDGKDRTYFPDLLVRTDDDLFFVIEIKGRRQLADRKTLAKAEAAKRQLGERGIGYCLADANGFALDDLRALEQDGEFRRHLKELLRANGVVMRRTFERAFDQERLGWAYDQLQSAVLREGMRYETRLTETPKAETRYDFDFCLRV